VNIEKMLKDSIEMEKEAWAVAEALAGLAMRHEDGAQGFMEEYARDLTFMETKAAGVAKMVAALPDEGIRAIFLCRYIHKMTWAEVADVACFSSSQVYRLHKKGIEWLEVNFKSCAPA